VEEKHIKRKKWVKRFTIIFFGILLVLTFFSNTIMNYSLPQVSTQSVTSETVSAKVRGTGTIEVADLKTVTINEAREISEILVSEGDTVKKGDVLIRLKEGESAELQEAEDSLKSLETAYRNNILVNEIEDRLVNSAENGGYNYDTTRSKLTSLSNNIKTIQEKVDNLQNQIDNINTSQSQSDDLRSNSTDNDSVGDDALDDNVSGTTINPELERLNKELETANKELENATKEHEEYLAEINTVNDLKSQYESIVAARENVEKIKNSALGNEITSPVDGKVTTIYVNVGDITTQDMDIATIQDSSNGYSLSFSVTNEQAKKVKIGDEATVSNSWYYGDVTVTLQGIKNDPSSSGKQKLLICSIDGDVNVGDSMTVSLGEKSGNYDYVVPNSAVREDNNGKFILVVKQKSSPLGNRYLAKRISVDVVASDDSKSAVTGALEGGEYVITTSNKMVNAGDLVRLAD
jgi:multidrug efflux pump subunit AcrA (membrane-fusion protein)